jgi:hypothetical protein
MTTMILERPVLMELYFGTAWNAEHAISQARQPTHFFVSTIISLTIFVFFPFLSSQVRKIDKKANEITFLFCLQE